MIVPHIVRMFELTSPKERVILLRNMVILEFRFKLRSLISRVIAPNEIFTLEIVTKLVIKF